MSKYFSKSLNWNEYYYKSYLNYELFSTMHVHKEWSRGFEMALIIWQHRWITLWHELFQSLYFLHSWSSNAKLFFHLGCLWFCFSGCKPECGRENWVLALWFTEAVLKYGKSEHPWATTSGYSQKQCPIPGFTEQVIST